MDDVTFCVTAFERPAALDRLLGSLKQFYPKVRVIVGDSSQRPVRLSHGTRLRLPFDCGIGYARNALLDEVATEFVMFLEDDFVFTSVTRIDLMHKTLLTVPELDAVAGMVLSRNGAESHYEGCLDLAAGVLTYRPQAYGEAGGLPLFECVYNFFLARTEKVRAVRWDPDLRLAEHTEFFLRAKGVLTVGYDERVRVQHPLSSSESYGKYRSRGLEYAAVAYAKHGIKSSVLFTGEVFTPARQPVVVTPARVPVVVQRMRAR